jgi:hypothetical protein
MALAQDFQGFTASVLPSQEAEVRLRKQAALSAHSNDVRLTLTQMPPEVTQELLGPYGPPKLEMVAAIEATVITRELSIENAAQEVNLDKEWLAGADHLKRRMDEVGLSEEDGWNIPEM